MTIHPATTIYVGDSRTGMLDVGALASRLYFYQVIMLFFLTLAIIKVVIESWLKSHTHKGMFCKCGLIKFGYKPSSCVMVNVCFCAMHLGEFSNLCFCAMHLGAFWNFNQLLCIDNSTNCNSLPEMVSFYMLSLRCYSFVQKF